jgi:hypothetical protein
VLNGTGAPANTLGNNGDFYIDTAANVLYGPKAAGGWPTTGTNLIGPQGQGGAQGPQGPAGPQGPQGNTGAPGTGATVAALASGDPHCANGGASVTDGNANTAYACNGSGAAASSLAGLQCPTTDGHTGTVVVKTASDNTISLICQGPGPCVNGTPFVTHNDGLGQTFLDCAPLNDWSVTLAAEAAAAWASANGGTSLGSLQCQSPVPLFTVDFWVAESASLNETVFWTYGLNGQSLVFVAGSFHVLFGLSNSCPITGADINVGSWG